jgi:hypothetical protein
MIKINHYKEKEKEKERALKKQSLKNGQNCLSVINDSTDLNIYTRSK